MRLFEFNNAGNDVPAYTVLPIQTKEEFVSYIQENCSDFLRQAKRQRMYRAVDWYSEQVLLMTSPTNRKPRDLAPRHQQMVDQVLMKRGLTALRSNSIFCLGNLSEIKEYGDDRFVVYPVNGFSYTWSPQIHDLLFFSKWRDQEFLEFVENVEFLNTRLDEGLKNGSEIYIHGKYVFAIDDIWHYDIRVN
jgi:hypothetical protein